MSHIERTPESHINLAVGHMERMDALLQRLDTTGEQQPMADGVRDTLYTARRHAAEVLGHIKAALGPRQERRRETSCALPFDAPVAETESEGGEA